MGPAPKRCLADPSIAVASMGISPDALLHDIPQLKVLFESMCIRDLRVYSQVLDGTMMHYHNDTGLEVDIIVELPDGRWGGHSRSNSTGERTMQPEAC